MWGRRSIKWCPSVKLSMLVAKEDESKNMKELLYDLTI